MKFGIWLTFGKACDHWPLRTLGPLVAWCYRSPLTWAYKALLSQVVNAPTQVIPRHSVNDTRIFNPFFSDLDLTIVIDSDDEKKNQLIRDFHHRWKKTFIFLGEIEIFTAAEFAEHHFHLSKISPLANWIRAIRKLKWLQDDSNAATTAYHRFKANRARGLLLNKFGISSQASRENEMRSLLQMGTQYLEFDAHPVSSLNLDTRHLGWSPEELWAACSSEDLLTKIFLVTPTWSEDPAVENQLVLGRQRPAIAALFHSYLIAEANQIQAVHRARPDLFPWMPAWASSLRLAARCGTVKI